MFHLAVQNQLSNAVFGANSKKNEKIGEFDPKSYYSNDYKINSDQQVGVPQKDFSITFLPRGGVLQNDYSITF